MSRKINQFIFIGVASTTIIGSLTGCGQKAENYDERIEAETNRMIADGELIDNTVTEDFDKEALKIIEDSNIGEGLKAETEEETQEQSTQRQEKVPFVESEGPDTIEVDGFTYKKIGKDFAPREYVFEGEDEYSSFSVIMDNKEHEIVSNGSGYYTIFDTAQGQYITYDEGCKVYPIAQATAIKKNEKGGYPQGMYKVGVQIPAGEYVAKGDCASLTVTHFLGDYDPEKGYCSNVRSAIISAKEGEYLECTEGDLFPIEATADLKPADGLYKDGTYKVGLHIPAGEYNLSCDGESAYVEIYNDCEMNKRADEVVEAPSGQKKAFTIKEGQYIMIYGGEVTKK